MGSGFNVDVGALGVFDSALYVGPGFTALKGEPTNKISRWNGTQLDSAGEKMHGCVNKFIVYNKELYAAGRFDMQCSRCTKRLLYS